MQSQSSKKITATLTQAAKDSIQIESFIYHVIRKNSEEPDYYDEVELDKEQKTFFEGRVRIACEGTQFKFNPPDNNTFKNDCLALLGDTKNKLVDISQELTNRFFGAHHGSTSDGVFITAVVSVLINNQRENLLSFLKVDYSKVYQQKIKDQGGKKIIKLERIMDSLADSPQAMQKWAVVDPTDRFVWDVLALQKNTSNAKKDTNKAISDYFKNFLQVTARESASNLTKTTVSETHKWAKGLADLPSDLPRPDYKARSIHYFENTDEFDTDTYIDQTLGSYTTEDMPEEEIKQRNKLREEHAKQLRDHLAEVGIAGQKFDSKPKSIPATTKTSKMKTHTGVEIKYQGTMVKNNISVKRVGNQQIITIKTTQLDEI